MTHREERYRRTVQKNGTRVAFRIERKGAGATFLASHGTGARGEEPTLIRLLPRTGPELFWIARIDDVTARELG
jgi:hypothetical protein